MSIDTAIAELRALANDARRCVDNSALDESYVIRLADRIAALASTLEHAAHPARRAVPLVERTRPAREERRPVAQGDDRLWRER